MSLIPVPLKHKQSFGLLFRFAVLVGIGAMMILYPQKIFPAAKRGIDTWWQVVFPGLFPFFVISELMLQFGVVHFLSIFLEPVMRPLFNVPGSGALVMAAGYTSGAPIGGVLTSHLHRQNLLNTEEASRLVAFTNNASPLFMLSSVAIGFLSLPEVGWILAVSHYTANIIVGIVLKHLSPNKAQSVPNYPITTLLAMAIRNMEKAQRENNKPLGHLLGDATKKAMQNILVVGGFIIVFSVLIEILSLLGFLKIVGVLIGYIMIPLGFEPGLLLPLASGLLEMTIGIKMIAESNSPLLQQLVCISLLLGWAGIAIHAQVAAFISEAGIPFGPYFLARLLQGILAAAITLITGHCLLPLISLEVINSKPISSFHIILRSVQFMAIILVVLIVFGSCLILYRNIKS